MRCPTPSELPPPPGGKSGWPWTVESPAIPEQMPDGAAWPRITVVTPSFNQGQYIEETLRSVLLQGYPNLEHIVIDGGSTDQSVEVIRRYEPWLAHWVSESDRGQSHAINKGAARASGEIFAWLNSDDCYLPGTLVRAAQMLAAHPEAGLIYGDAIQRTIGGEEAYIRARPLDTVDLVRFGCLIEQPTVFMRRSVFEQAGGLDESLHFALDYDLWLRLSLLAPLHYAEGPPLAVDVRHPMAKTDAHRHRFWPENRRALTRMFNREALPPRVQRERRGALARAHYDNAVVATLAERDLLAASRLWAQAIALDPTYLWIGPARLLRRLFARRNVRGNRVV